MKTNEELKQLANDMMAGRIFTDRHVKRPQDLGMVFMLFSLMDNKAMKEFESQEPVMVYEYMDKASPRSINGMPSFFSFHFLTQPEFDVFKDYHDKIKAAISDIT